MKVLVYPLAPVVDNMLQQVTIGLIFQGLLVFLKGHSKVRKFIGVVVLRVSKVDAVWLWDFVGIFS